MGRKKYVPSIADKTAAYQGAMNGLNEKEIAKQIGISYTAFQKYKDEFAPLIKKGRIEGQPKNKKVIVNALIKRAAGYEYTETHMMKKTITGISLIDGTKVTGATTIEKKTVNKYIPGSVAAMIFWLCNKAKREWQSVHKIEIGVDQLEEMILADLGDISTKDLKIIKKILGPFLHGPATDKQTNS